MISRIPFLPALVLATSAFAAPVAAQTEALTLTNMTVTRYDVLPNLDTDIASPCCARHVFESGADTDFIYIDADFAVAWSDELERVQISSRDIGLQLANETEPRQAWGRFSFFPHVELGGTSLNARRPRDWPEENAGGYLNLVFEVPAGTTAATLVLGEGENTLQLPVDLNVPVSELPRSSDYYSVSIASMTLVDELVTEDRAGRTEIAGRITPGLGAITRVDVTVTGLTNTDTDAEPGENQIFFRNTAFALVGPEGLPLIPLGRSVSGSIRNGYSNSSSWDGEGASNGTSVTLFFLGSGNSGDYELFFYDQSIGKLTL